jgi:hypothetical protein
MELRRALRHEYNPTPKARPTLDVVHAGGMISAFRNLRSGELPCD